jgi:hypothetical protein
MDNLNDTGKEKTEASNLNGIHLLGRLLQTKTPSRVEGFGGGMAAEKTSSQPHARDGVIDT